MTLIAGVRSTDGLRVSTVGISLTVFFALSFILCVLGGLLFPDMIVHRTLNLLLPWFEWLSWRSFLVGLIGSIGWAWYIAIVFVPIYNFVRERF